MEEGKMVHPGGAPRLPAGGTDVPTDTIDLARLARMVRDLPRIDPTVIVRHPYVLAGSPWKVLDEGTTYFFIHPTDLSAIPARDARSLAPSSAKFLGSPVRLYGIPIREYDDEMRAVFVRALDRLAGDIPTALAQKPTP